MDFYDNDNINSMSTTETISNLVETFIVNYTRSDFLHRFLNIILYQGDFGTISAESNTTEIIDYFGSFIKDITSDISDYNLKIVKKNVIGSYNFIKQILEVKEDISVSININYDNVTTHYTGLKTETLILLNEVLENKITNLSDFRKEFNKLYSEIQIYNQFKYLRPTLKDLDHFIEESNDYSGSIVNWLKNFNDIILKASTNLSELSALKKEGLVDSYFVFSDKESSKEPVNKIMDFLKSSFRIYKTGYDILDGSDSIDSSSLTIIAGPTNHAKSIFMLNIMKKMIENSKDFDENDAFVFVSLEDDQFKIYKRLSSIFGNYDNRVIKSLFSQSSSLLTSNQNIADISTSSIYERLFSLFEEVTNNSIIDITENKIKFIVKYAGENTFSSSDACRLLDSLIFQNLKPRALFIDYVDVMIPSPNNGGSSNKSNSSDYVDQGKIIHELRKASRKYSIPIITITQNTRYSENSDNELDNSHLADSFKKARYSDSVFMIRQRPELDILNDTVSPDLMIDENLNFSNIPQDYLKTLIPFEVKVTKSKDGQKNQKRFHVFCHKNLRIYQNINEFISDIDICKTKSENLQSKLNIVGLNADIEINTESDNIDNLFL